MKIGNSVYQLDDAALATAIDNQLTKYDSATQEIADLKIRLDAAETARTTLDSQLSEAQASLATANAAKVQADADIAALQTKLDAAMDKLKKSKALNEEGDEADSSAEEEDSEKPKGKKAKMDSDEIKSYCKEFLTVVSEVTPALKKVDSAFEPDFGLSPLDYKAQYLKTLPTLPQEAKARIDSTGDERNMFVEHLYLALKPQVAEAPAKADEGTSQLADAIEKNRSLTMDAGDLNTKNAEKTEPRVDSRTMEARKNRPLPSAYRK